MHPFEQPATAARLRWLAGQGLLDPATLERALAAAGQLPTPKAWARFVSMTLLVLGAALAVAGVFFFFAYNWDDLHRFAKLGLLAAIVAASGGFALWRGLERIEGQVALVAACALLGALLAVFGQVYQTGADSFLLFASWAALIVVPTLFGRNAPLWLLLLALVNLSLVFFFEQRMAFGFRQQFAALFALNAVWVLGWEFGRTRAGAWMASFWYRRAVLAVAALWGVLTVLQVVMRGWSARDDGLLLLLGPLAALLLGGVATIYYRWRSPDLPALSLLAFCAIILITAQLAEWTRWDNAVSYLALSLSVVAQLIGASFLLLRAARAMEASR